MSVRPSICNMYEIMKCYYPSTANLRNYAFVCLIKGVLNVEYRRLHCRISSPTKSWKLAYLICHSGALKPRMPTPWNLLRPSLMNALAAQRISS